MAHPYHKHGHKNDPKWLRGVRKYADGGNVEKPEDVNNPPERQPLPNVILTRPPLPNKILTRPFLKELED